MPLLLDINQASEELSMSPSKITRLVNDGILPKPVYIGGCKRFKKSDLDRWVEKLSESGTEQPKNKRGRPRLGI